MEHNKNERLEKWCQYVEGRIKYNPLSEMDRLLKENTITEKDIPEFMEMVSNINRISLNIRYMEKLLKSKVIKW